MIRQFVDTATGPGGVAIATAGTEFEDIIGVRAPVAGAAAEPSAPTAPVAAPAAPAAPARRRGGRVPALVAMASLAVAGLAISGGVIVAADLVSRGPLTAPDAVLASEKADGARAVATPATTPFGSTSALGEDLTISVSDPIAYTPSPGAIGAGAGVDVVSTVTITNTGSGPVNPRVRLEAIGTPATPIFDRAQGIRTNTVPSLATGASVTYRIAYAVDTVAAFELRVTSPGGDHLVYGP